MDGTNWFVMDLSVQGKFMLFGLKERPPMVFAAIDKFFKHARALGPFNDGLAMFKQKRIDEALLKFREAVSIDPSFAEAHCNEGLCLIEKKNYEQAIACLEKSIALKRLHPALLNRGNANLFLGRYDDAIADFNDCLGLDPKTVVAYQNRAVCHLNSGRLQDALSNCNSGLNLDPANSAILINRGLVYFRLDEAELAEYDFRAALRLNPGSIKSRNMLAISLSRQERLEEALDECTTAIQIGGNAEDTADCYCARGAVHAKLGKLKDARADLDKCIEINPGHQLGHINLGSLAVQLKQYQDALQYFAQASALGPESFDLFINRGVAHRELDRAMECLEDFRAALGLKSDSIRAQNALAEQLLRLKRYEESLTLFDKIVESSQPVAAATFSNRAAALMNVGRLDEAESVLLKILDKEPDYVPALVNLATLYFRRQEFARSGEYAERVLKIDPENADAMVCLGGGFVRLRRYRESIERCNVAIALRPRCAEAYANRAGAYAGLYEYDKALADCDTALSFDPGFGVVLCNRAAALVGLNRFEEAEEACYSALRVESDGNARINLGWSFSKRCRYDEALAEYDLAICSAPDETEARRNRAGALLTLARYDEVVSEVAKILELDETFPEAYAIRALVNQITGAPAQAWNDMEKCCELGPDLPSSMIVRALVKFYAGDGAGAIDSANAAVSSSRGHANMLGVRAFILLHCGKHAEALQDILSATEINPLDKSQWATLSLCAYYSGNYDQAVEHANTALSVNENSADALIALGIAYSGKQLYEESSACFEKIFAINPRHPIAYFYRSLSREGAGDQQGFEEDMRRARELGFRFEPRA